MAVNIVTDFGCVCVSSLKLFQVGPLLPDVVQHFLVTHHLLKVPLVACKVEKRLWASPGCII